MQFHRKNPMWERTDPQTAFIVIQIHTHTVHTVSTNTLLSDNPAPVYED